jgi:hypothetical protein
MKKIWMVACLSLGLVTRALALDTWDVYNERYELSQHQTTHIDDVDLLVEPFLMPDDHPLKEKLDQLFLRSRVISSRKTLVAAGFEDKKPEPVTKIIVTRHSKMKGYIFKIYTDDYLDYHHGEPEVYTYLRRARGAKMIKDEIVKLGWSKYFKVPAKWIYKLPDSPAPLKPEHFNRQYILVEEEMDLLSKEDMKSRWKDGTMTTKHLDKLFYMTTRLGLRGCCKYDNVPICSDGKIAFVDTQSNLRWPIAYNRLKAVLEGDMLKYWNELIKDSESIVRIVDVRDE